MRNALLVLGVAALPFAAGPATAPVTPARNLAGSVWTLATLAGRALRGHDHVTLEFNAGRVQGTDGCNRYSGPYSTTGAQIKIGPDLASTQMACPAPVMRLAGSYINVLLVAKAYRVRGAELRLVDANGNEIATFAALTHSLTDLWGVTGLIKGREVVVSVLSSPEQRWRSHPSAQSAALGG